MEFGFSVKMALVVIMIIFFALRSSFTKHYNKYTPKILVKYVTAVVLFFAYFWGLFDSAMIPLSHIVRLVVGLSIMAIGFALFFWAHIHLANNWSPVIEKKFGKSRKLVKSGPYQYVRHPIYTASFIVLIGIFIFTANWLLGGIPAVILCLFYSSKIPREEAELTRNFGRAYTEYKKKTYSLIPYVY